HVNCYFIQAEDGIRDRNVTGVQTCALPISLGPHPRTGSRTKRRRPPACGRTIASRSVFVQHFPGDLDADRRGEAAAGEHAEDPRSEERRVGKERTTHTSARRGK